MLKKRFITGCTGLELTTDEVAFFRECRPWGLILFARNCEHRDQVRKLCDTFRESVEHTSAPILIDEEGGRVQRLKPPHWCSYPAPGEYGKIHAMDRDKAKSAAELYGRIIGYELREVGININCIPSLDLPIPNASDIIGNRAFSNNAEVVIDLANSLCSGLKAAGVIPVIKHIPGHGRSLVDSHHELPIVEASLKELEHDFQPFQHFRNMPFAITAHVIYKALDRNNPATVSPVVISEIIRGKIGFDGCLLSDDISMEALSGNVGERARRIIQAGCDIVLHCNGKMHEMEQVADASPEISGLSEKRSSRGLKFVVETIDFDIEKDRREYQNLLVEFGINNK